MYEHCRWTILYLINENYSDATAWRYGKEMKQKKTKWLILKEEKDRIRKKNQKPVTLKTEKKGDDKYGPRQFLSREA